MALSQNQQVPTDRADPSDRVEQLLDRAIEDSFPTSDPVSLALPHADRDFRRMRHRSRMTSALPLAIIGGALLALLLLRRR